MAALLLLVSACIAPPKSSFSRLPPEVRKGMSPASCVSLLADRYDGGLDQNPLALTRVLERLAPMGRTQVLDVLREYTSVRAVLPYECEHGEAIVSTPSPAIVRAVCLAMFAADDELLPPQSPELDSTGGPSPAALLAWRPTYPLIVVGGLPYFVRHRAGKGLGRAEAANFDAARPESWVEWASDAPYRGWDETPVDNPLLAVEHFLWGEFQAGGWVEHFGPRERQIIARVMRLQAYRSLEGCADELLRKEGLAVPRHLGDVTNPWWKAALALVGPRTEWKSRKRRYVLK